MKRLLQAGVLAIDLVLLPVLAGTESVEGIMVLLFFCALTTMLFVAACNMPSKMKADKRPARRYRLKTPGLHTASTAAAGKMPVAARVGRRA